MNQFNEIWLPLAERFYRVAYYLLESQEDAEDAVQEAFLRVAKNFHKMIIPLTFVNINKCGIFTFIMAISSFIPIG